MTIDKTLQDTPAVPPSVRGSGVDESYSAVLAAREENAVTLPLGDGDALDALAMRDHVIGLQAELVNAKAEAAHARRAAEVLRTELGRTLPVRVLRAVRGARKIQLSIARRREAARRPQ